MFIQKINMIININNLLSILNNYDADKLWVDRLIIRGFDHNGKQHKICRLYIDDKLNYIPKIYSKLPKNEDLETWEETYKRLEKQILEQESYSLNVILNTIKKYDGYTFVQPTSMGKDSKLVEYLLNKSNINYQQIFNNTTCDSADVYREVKERKNIQIITPTDNNGKNLSLYKMMETQGIASRQSRWCCSIFKEGGTMQYLKDKNNILMFLGMRNEESSTRSNYGDEWRNIAWTNNFWQGCLPIRKWTELELWLYTLHNNIPINEKYKKGYQRVGCHICCPFYTKSTWILDKYWYKEQFDRFHNILNNDFIDNEKWTRMNCTLEEYHMNWNGGQVREQPTDAIIKEFMRHKELDDENVAKQYFNKICFSCGKNVYKKNEVAMNLKYFGRNTDRFLCKKCFLKQLGMTNEHWNKKIEDFKRQECKLF